jgi:deoxycytidine triphosphate deaminase
MLSNSDIVEKIRSGEIEIVTPDEQPVIDPATGHERETGQLQAHGYDIRAEAVYDWSKPHWHILEQGEEFTLNPGQFLAIRTYERFRLSPNIAATIHSMARHTLLGLIHISTTVHPGWAQSEDSPKPFIIAVANISKAPIKIGVRETFCRLLFYETRTPATMASPTLDMVRKRFDKAKYQLSKRYGKQAQTMGWLLLLISIAVAAGILAVIQNLWPQYMVIAIPLLIILLGIILEWIRKRFNILS